MNKLKRNTITVWVAKNKNGKLSMHTVEPYRDEVNGIWESSSPFINSILYKNLSEMIDKTLMNWESSPEPFQLHI